MELPPPPPPPQPPHHPVAPPHGEAGPIRNLHRPPIEVKLPGVDAGSRLVRVVVVSDTHNKHNLIEILPGDILVHCGDFTNKGGSMIVAAQTRWSS